MPSIDALVPVVAVADTDEVLVSQGGVARKATRAQVVAGLQPTLAVGPQTLLGRSNDGLGAPEEISIGTNLSLVSGQLSATASPFNIGLLPSGLSPAQFDAVAISQGSQNVQIPYGQFMSGLSSLHGVDVSGLTAVVTGAMVARSLADLAADAVAVESFGAVGDGTTDDTEAIAAAVASGRPVRFAARTYIVNGQFTIATAGVVLLGVPGATTLRRLNQVGNGAWIAVQGDRFSAHGIVFDANNMAVTQDSWGVFVSSACTQTSFERCAFRNASGASLGSGLVFQASDPQQCRHTVRDCEASGNAVHGIWVQACRGVLVAGCLTYGNGSYGINVDFNDPTFVQKARFVQVSGNRAWNNTRGIAVGNFNQSNTQPPVWGNANPDAVDILVVGNVCHGNTAYGIAASGQGLIIADNLICDNALGSVSGAGLLANVSYSRLSGNLISGASAYGIDVGGSIYSEITGNVVSGAGIGINCGGSTAVRVTSNTLRGNTLWAVLANNVETDGHGNNFGIACSLLALTGNWIELPSATAGGMLLLDGPQNVLVERNITVGGASGLVTNCLWPNTDSIRVVGNVWNLGSGQSVAVTVNGVVQQLVYPDISDEITITSAPAGVQSTVSAYQAQMAGQVAFVKIAASGAGYSHALVSIGGMGSGAFARAVISAGAIIGVVVTSTGSGYGPIGATVPVTISGDGTGAIAIGYVSVPIADARRLTVRCGVPVHFARAGSIPLQDNWTGTDLDIPAGAEVVWVGTSGHWQAVRFNSTDQIDSDGAGGTVIRSGVGGDVILRPQGSGQVRLSSDASVIGCVSAVGHGSPVGSVIAPPGSDYRNLDGGVGATFWIKRSGTDANGWSAVA